MAWVGWLVVNSGGWFLCLLNLIASAIATADNLSQSANNLLPKDMLDFVISLTVIWGFVGVAQGLLLRTYIHHTLWWVSQWALVCAISWTGFWVLTYAYPNGPFIPNMPMVWIPASIGVGLLQWLVLRSYIQQAGWWIVMIPGAIVVTLVIIWGIDQILLETVGGASDLFLVVDVFTPGIIFGAITGFFLILFLKTT